MKKLIFLLFLLSLIITIFYSCTSINVNLFGKKIPIHQTKELSYTDSTGHRYNEKELIKMINSGEKNNIGLEALMGIAVKNEIDYMKQLLKRGANINAKRYGWTALHAASQYGHPEMVTLLIKEGADVNYVHVEQKMTALELAAWKGHLDCVRILLEANAEVTSSAILAAENNKEIHDLLLNKFVGNKH